MDIPLNILFLAIGVTLLIKGADWLINGSVLSAQALHFSNLLIGIVVVAFGTSTPELLVSLIAVWNDNPDISIGNVIGSCIANIGLVLGLVAIINPCKQNPRILINRMLFMLVSVMLLVFFIIDCMITRIEGLILLMTFLLFLVYSIIQELKGKENDSYKKRELKPRFVLITFLGLASLVIGAELLVKSGEFLARLFGVSDLVIGLSVVALGTSLPETATSIVAVIRGELNISIGNIIGSNIFNILLILGLVSLITPLEVLPNAADIDIWVLLVYTVLIIVMMIIFKGLNRWFGIVLISSYFLYIGYLFGR